MIYKTHNAYRIIKLAKNGITRDVHKYLVESHWQSKCIGVFLLFERDIAFYFRTKYCVKFYTEKNTNMY